MKLLIDDTTGRTHNLNANEACVYAAILKCTKAGRGWFANYRDLADALPFVISRPTTYRAVQKLLNLGLIYEDEKKVLFAVQNEQIAVQNEQTAVQNEQTAVQNEQIPNSPYNPLIINNDMERENIATCAQTCDTRTPKTPSFDDLIKAYEEKAGRGQLARNGATDLARDAWEKCSTTKKIKLVEAIKSGAHFKQRLDWSITDFPEPQPYFLSGVEQDNCHVACIPLVQVKYNGKFLICTRATMELFGLEWVRDW